MSLKKFGQIHSQRGGVLQCDCVIQRGANAAHRAMTLKLNHFTLFGAFQELLFESLIAAIGTHTEHDIRTAAESLVNWTSVKTVRGLNNIVNQLRFLSGVLFHCCDAAVFLNPFQHLTNNVDAAMAGRSVVKINRFNKGGKYCYAYINVGGVLYSELASKFALKSKMAGVMGRA